MLGPSTPCACYAVAAGWPAPAHRQAITSTATARISATSAPTPAHNQPSSPVKASAPVTTCVPYHTSLATPGSTSWMGPWPPRVFHGRDGGTARGLGAHRTHLPARCVSLAQQHQRDHHGRGLSTGAAACPGGGQPQPHRQLPSPRWCQWRRAIHVAATAPGCMPALAL